MVDDIAHPVELGEHFLVEHVPAGFKGAAVLVAGVFGPVAGDADADGLHAVAVDAHAHGQAVAAVCLFTVSEDGPQAFVQVLVVTDGGEVILAEAAQAREMLCQDLAHLAQELVALVEVVLAVIVLHADHVKVQQHRVLAFALETVPLGRGKFEEIPHVRQTRQHIRVDPAVEVGDRVPELVAHAQERLGQLADLVPRAVGQRNVVVPVGQALGCRRQPQQRVCDVTHDQQDEYCRDGDDDKGDDRDGANLM